MRRILARWLLTSVPLVLLVSALTFVLVSFIPGDAARKIVGQNGTAEQYAHVRHELGLDQPLWQQYWDWLTGAVRGDLGRSLLSGEPVIDTLSGRGLVTVYLMVGSVIVAATLGVALGVASAVRRGVLARLVDAISLLGMAIPNFWLGLIFIAIFAVALGLFPATGYVPLAESPAQWIGSLILPIITLGIGSCAGIAKQTRDAMLDELGREYVFTLRAQGLPERSIIIRHALKNAAVPVVTLLGVLFIGLLGGSVLVESVFVLPGLGSLAVQATLDHDIPVIQGVAVLFTIVVVAVNLVIELIYGWLSPRTRVPARMSKQLAAR